MKTLQSLYEIELKNLYALEKQSTEIKDRIRYNFNDEKIQKRFEKFCKNSEDSFKSIQEYLADKDINPGSTVDSVMKEILQNIVDITNKRINKDIKEAGLLCSLNRATHYKIACYKNIKELSKQLNMDDVEEELKSIRKNHKKETKKIKNITIKA